MFTHLLVPIDGSELAEGAVQPSIALAKALGARITGFVAEDLPPLPTESGSLVAYRRDTDEHLARTEAHARKVLASFGALAAEQGVPFTGEFRRTDAVPDAIVTAAVDFGCDLVVMATHGRGTFGELLFGSHTKHVMTHSKLPLLVLH
jgi:nucleotide-binding universal stress UspA family protein